MKILKGLCAGIAVAVFVLGLYTSCAAVTEIEGLVRIQLERFLDSAVAENLAAPLVFIEVPKVLNQLPKEVKQALVVVSRQDESSQAELTAWHVSQKGWEAAISFIPVVIGRNSFAAEGYKKEGDGRTPSGIFKLGTAFGYALSSKTGLAYRQATADDFWVDDPKSAQYNQWVTGAPQAKSFERLKRDDDLYRYGVVIEYNVDPIVPGKGSAIFMHVWRGPDSPTAGCVAMSQENILGLLKWLDRGSHPVIVLGNK